MRILAVGDVVGESGLLHLEQTLWDFRRREKVDFTVVNGENASDIHGLSAEDAKRIFAAGADVITLGNHAFGMKDLYPLLDSETPILRPGNYPPEVPGRGYEILDANGYKVLCINLSGRANMEPLADPFAALDGILERENRKYDVSVLDFHAEATSEKIAFGRCFDGKVGVIFGTHTHVPTADAGVLPGGTGYVTDLGMCGAVDSVIGADTQQVIQRFRTQIGTRFHAAKGEATADAVLFSVDPSANKTRAVWRVKF